MMLRRLNEKGLARLSAFLQSFKTDTPEDVPLDILASPDTSEDIGVPIEVERRTFTNRFDAARYLDQKLSGSDLRNIESDAGLWAWLALFYFDQLCPPASRGRRSPGEAARWILQPTRARRYYKHLLAGPYLIYRAHRDNAERAMVLLSGGVHTLNEFVNQLASRQETVTNKSLMQAITTLYIDPTTLKAKRGAQTKGPGGPRRLATVLNQLDVTWDLYVATTDELLRCLPREFDRFRR
jgi:hypothetical protein